MTFQPIIPLAGFAGWKFLQRTLSDQKESHASASQNARLTTYFRDNIAKVSTADDLVNDRQLLQVALGAYGLSDDINSKAFIRTLLTEGTEEPEALANRLADKRYARFAKDFGFGDTLGAQTESAGFAEKVLTRFADKSFEISVGEADEDMRLSLSVGPALSELLTDTKGDDARWFALMGNPPLRRVVEKALGLPSGLGKLDIEQQMSQFKSRAETVFGTHDLQEIAAPETQDKLVRMFLLHQQLDAGAAQSSGSLALTLLQASPFNYGN